MFRARSGIGATFTPWLGLALATLALPARADSRPERVIVVEGSIQAAVDAARPGDTLFVPPGLYHEAVVVDKSGITILGPRTAILDATGFENAIRVGTAEVVRDESGTPVCPAPSIHDFVLLGMTVRNAAENGVFLIGVDGFELVAGRYVDNEAYGPFPVCSRNGLIAYNEASGHKDAAIYVGDDDQVLVTRNRTYANAVGIEIENSTRAVVRRNLVVGNTTGILVVVLPDLPFPFAESVLIDQNWVLENNFPNPVPMESGDPVGLLPSGTGIVNVGGDAVHVRRNLVARNGSVGIALVPTLLGALDPRVDPFPDANVVRQNLVVGNGLAPDWGRLAGPPADLVYLPDLIDPETAEVLAEDPAPDNCFGHNLFRTQFPAGISDVFSCR